MSVVFNDDTQVSNFAAALAAVVVVFFDSPGGHRVGPLLETGNYSRHQRRKGLTAWAFEAASSGQLQGLRLGSAHVSGARLLQSDIQVSN